MPFCTQCGHQVGPADAFCAGCGARQPAAAAGATSGGGRKPFASDTNPRTIAALCYVPVLGWIASLYVLATDRFRFDRTVRFHAFQGLYLFVGWLILDWVVGPMLGVGLRLRWITSLLKTAISVVGVVMLVKTLRNQDEHLPFVGDLAERSVREQQ